jgi:hypothetical protein
MTHGLSSSIGCPQYAERTRRVQAETLAILSRLLASGTLTEPGLLTTDSAMSLAPPLLERATGSWHSGDTGNEHRPVKTERGLHQM